MTSREIIRIIGVLLLVLGSVSGVALFIRAVVGDHKISEGPGIATLWGLFVVGMLAGIIIIASTG